MTDQEKIREAGLLLKMHRTPEVVPHPRERSRHQKRVEEFMTLAEQEIPLAPTIPDAKTRILRAKLIFEEALETAVALGVLVCVDDDEDSCFDEIIISSELLKFSIGGSTPDLEQIADGCADLKVVTTGTLSACGIADEALQHAVDCSNLEKFGPGGHKREDGKWVKGPEWKAPDILGILKAQTLG